MTGKSRHWICVSGNGRRPAARTRYQQAGAYFNNVGQALITIPDHPGQTGVGPLAGSDVSKQEDPEH